MNRSDFAVIVCFRCVNVFSKVDSKKSVLIKQVWFIFVDFSFLVYDLSYQFFLSLRSEDELEEIEGNVEDNKKKEGDYDEK